MKNPTEIAVEDRVIPELICQDDDGEVFYWPQCRVEGCKNYSMGMVYGGICHPHAYPGLHHSILRLIRGTWNTWRYNNEK